MEDSGKDVIPTGYHIVECCDTCEYYHSDGCAYYDVEVWSYYVCDSFLCDGKGYDQLRES
jgi:hypothetical protein